MTDLPLTGTLVLDLSRMLPGAILARQLVDLGARVIKIEDPLGGDPMRSAPPLVDGVGAGFRALLRGTESVCLDLRTPTGQAALRQLALGADVLVESFRPGTLARWELGHDRLSARNAGLVTLSLSGFGLACDGVAHDLNLMAASGLLSLLPPGRLPQTQFADVSTGLLAATAVLGALLARHRTGRGAHLDQPLATGPLPFVAWPMADRAAGGAGLPEALLAGQLASYGVYPCADGLALAVATLEPKFWRMFRDAVGLNELPDDPLCCDPSVRHRLAARLLEQPRAAWLAHLSGLGLPVTPVHDLDGALANPGPETGVRENALLTASGGLNGTGSWLPAYTPPTLTPVPDLGADTHRVLVEFGANGP